MRNAVSTLLAFLALITLQAQYNPINFDDGNLDWIKFDTMNPNNNWQIGPPQKVLFDSAYSYPNVIITDTLNYYSIDNISMFYVFFCYHTPLNWPELSFKFKINTDSISDFGNIEASYDNGNTWIEVIKDAEQYDIEWVVYGKDLGGGNFEIIAVYGVDSIAFTGTSNIWYTFQMSMYGWDNYFPFNDTIIYRISFHSDDNQTNKEGWMIDNIWVDEWFSYIDEAPQKALTIKTYPNPFTTSTTFEYTLQRPLDVHITIYNVQGQIVGRVQERQDKGVQRVEWKAEGLPGGILFIRMQVGNESVVKTVVKME